MSPPTETEYQHSNWRDPALGQETFGKYANRWYEAQDLAASTMQNYRRHIKKHLLPEFEDKALASILRADVNLWEKKETAVYAASSVKTWRSTLHLIFEDAIDEGLITSTGPQGGAGVASAPAASGVVARRWSSPTHSASY